MSDFYKRMETKKKALVFTRASITGAGGENRTHDPVLTKDVRYHYATPAAPIHFGGRLRIRTADPMRVKHML